MKHTTFENELKDIRRNAINELEKAVGAHKGNYSWEVSERPKMKDGRTTSGIYTRKKEDGETYRFRCTLFTSQNYDDGTVFLNENVFVEEMPIEDIIAITEAIPETADVKDVSGVYPVPITWVDRNDIENIGYSGIGLTQELLQSVAEEMCESYLNSGYVDDLEYAYNKVINENEKED